MATNQLRSDWETWVNDTGYNPRFSKDFFCFICGHSPARQCFCCREAVCPHHHYSSLYYFPLSFNEGCRECIWGEDAGGDPETENQKCLHVPCTLKLGACGRRPPPEQLSFSFIHEDK